MKDWAPLIGSSVIAFVTLVVLIVNQRQNRETLRLSRLQHQEALEAAEAREWLQWKRTKLAALCDEVLTVAHTAASTLNSAPAWERTEFQKNWFDINNTVASIPDLARRLELIVGDGLDKEITAVLSALADSMDSAMDPENRWTGGVEPSKLAGSLGRMAVATQRVADASRAFAAAARLLLEEPAGHLAVTDQTDSPRSTEPTDPPVAEPPQDA